MGVLRAWDRLRRDARFAGTLLKKRPFQLLLQVTNRCNMTCDFCDFWPHGAKHDELTFAEYERLEAELSAISCFMISIEGGEPFVRKDIIEIVRLFGRRHVPVLFTNGWFIDAAAAHALFDAGVAQVGVSIDYPDAARHDARRGIKCATERAWQAVEHLERAAPHPDRQIHVMTVLMRENQACLEPLLQQSAAAGVGHGITLIATGGYRRGEGASRPDPGLGAQMSALWKRYPHLRTFRDYVAGIDPWLSGAPQSRCNAGTLSFNIDHTGGVASCIEHIDRPVGTVRDTPLRALLERLPAFDDVSTCQDCWTACRGFAQLLGEDRGVRSFADLTMRMRSS